MTRPNLHDVVSDPEWLPHTYDAAGSELTFVHVPRAAHSDLMFLSDEHYQGRFDKAAFPAPLVGAELAPVPKTPLHFIFHTSFCGSTLLARALTVPGASEALKEPDVLINVGNRLIRSDDAANRQRLDLVLKLLERSTAVGEATIVKPTNFANRIMEPALAMRPDARAIFLHSDLETFLRSLVRRGLFGRRFGRQLFLQLSNWVPVDFGLSPAETFELTDLQVTALAWLMQIAHFDALARAHGPGRVLILDAADLTSDPSAVLDKAQHFLGLGLDRQQIDEIVNGPVFARHSKLGEAYGPEQRQRERDAVTQAHGEELAMVIKWAEAVADRLGLPQRLG